MNDTKLQRKESLLASFVEALEYYEHFARVRPDEEHWKNGIAITRRIIDLVQAESASQEQVTDILEVLARDKSEGSQWIGLRINFKTWTAISGFDTSSSES